MCEHPRGLSGLCELPGSDFWLARFTGMCWGIIYSQLLVGLKKSPRALYILILPCHSCRLSVCRYGWGRSQKVIREQHWPTFPETKQQRGVVPAAAVPYMVWPLNVKRKKSLKKDAIRNCKYCDSATAAEIPLPVLRLFQHNHQKKLFLTRAWFAVALLGPAHGWEPSRDTGARCPLPEHPSAPPAMLWTSK